MTNLLLTCFYEDTLKVLTLFCNITGSTRALVFVNVTLPVLLITVKYVLLGKGFNNVEYGSLLWDRILKRECPFLSHLVSRCGTGNLCDTLLDQRQRGVSLVTTLTV